MRSPLQLLRNAAVLVVVAVSGQALATSPAAGVIACGVAGDDSGYCIACTDGTCYAWECVIDGEFSEGGGCGGQV